MRIGCGRHLSIYGARGSGVMLVCPTPPSSPLSAAVLLLSSPLVSPLTSSLLFCWKLPLCRSVGRSALHTPQSSGMTADCSCRPSPPPSRWAADHGRRSWQGMAWHTTWPGRPEQSGTASSIAQHNITCISSRRASASALPHSPTNHQPHQRRPVLFATSGLHAAVTTATEQSMCVRSPTPTQGHCATDRRGWAVGICWLYLTARVVGAACLGYCEQMNDWIDEYDGSGSGCGSQAGRRRADRRAF